MKIYEHGICVGDDEIVSGLNVIATTDQPIFGGAGFTLNIVNFSGASLVARCAYLAQINGAYRVSDFFEENDLRYCLFAALYHLNNLIDLYVSVTQLFEGIHPIGTANSGNTGNNRVCYEIDAFLAGALRVYDLGLRKMLWKHYGNAKGKEWRYFHDIFVNPESIPAQYLDELKNNWSAYGNKLKDYRNSVSHRDTAFENGPTCWLKWYDQKWGASIKLPANPEVKNKRAFDFTSGPDALAYCHIVACHLVDICELLENQAAVRHHREHPQL